MTYPVVVYGVPLAPPAPPPNPWPGITDHWTGWDGSIWNLSSKSSQQGVVLRPGVRGRNMPPVQHHETESEARAGSRWRSTRTLKREIFWPLAVFQDSSSQDWIDHDAAFWRTMHPEKPGLWTVTKPDGTQRTLLCRFVEDGGHAGEWAPGVFGWMNYGITLQAEQPYWSGAPVTRSWSVGTGDVDFIPATGAPPFNISVASTFASAAIANLGDVSAWITWTIKGPIDAGLEVGVAGSLIGYPNAIADGETLVINSRDMAAKLDGIRVSQSLDPRDFAPVEPGESVALSINAAGTGTVTASLTPLFFRAT